MVCCDPLLAAATGAASCSLTQFVQSTKIVSKMRYTRRLNSREGSNASCGSRDSHSKVYSTRGVATQRWAFGLGSACCELFDYKNSRKQQRCVFYYCNVGLIASTAHYQSHVERRPTELQTPNPRSELLNVEAPLGPLPSPSLGPSPRPLRLFLLTEEAKLIDETGCIYSINGLIGVTELEPLIQSVRLGSSLSNIVVLCAALSTVIQSN